MALSGTESHSLKWLFMLSMVSPVCGFCVKDFSMLLRYLSPGNGSDGETVVAPAELRSFHMLTLTGFGL